VIYNGTGAYDHAAIKCDNGLYVSAHPKSGIKAGGDDIEWYPESKDVQAYGSPKSTTCSDCIDESKVSNWFNSLPSPAQFGGLTANCSDYARNGMLSGLNDDQQKQPACPCSWVLTYEVIDLLNPYPHMPSTPTGFAKEFKEFLDNKCQRYKCKATGRTGDMPPWGPGA
jgi:hypothetical protein